MQKQTRSCIWMDGLLKIDKDTIVDYHFVSCHVLASQRLLAKQRSPDKRCRRTNGASIYDKL